MNSRNKKVAGFFTNMLLVVLLLGILIIPIGSLGVMGYSPQTEVLSIQDQKLEELNEEMPLETTFSSQTVRDLR